MKTEKGYIVPAIVLGMSANGLSVVRSLGRKGIPVVGIDDKKSLSGMFSKYCTHIICPDVVKNEEDFLDFLIHYATKLSQKAILFLTDDKYITIVSREREKLDPYYKFNLPDKWIVESFLNKGKSYILAQKYGLFYPRTYYINNIEDLKNILRSIQYPCALKPVYSHLWRIKYGGEKLLEVDSPKDIIDTYVKLRNEGQQVMVQEIIPGGDSAIYCFMVYFNRGHQPLAMCTKRKLRQYPIHFGISSLSISERNENLINIGLDFLSNINYTGFAGMEFKRDFRDKKFKFLENNLRTLMSGELFISCGVDFPYIYYQDLIGEKVKKTDDFKEGVKLVNLELDIASFWHYRKLKELTFFQWIKSLKGNLKHTYFAWDDLVPFLFVCYRFMKIVLTKVALSLLNSIKDTSFSAKRNNNIDVLHLVSSSGLFGKENVIIEVAKEMKKRGESVKVGVIKNTLCPHTEIVDSLKSLQLPYTIFNCKAKFDLRTIFSIRAFLKKEEIDILHGHGYKSNFYGVIASLFLKTKRVTTVHNWIKTDIKLKIYALLDKLLLRKFDAIIVVSEKVKEEIVHFGITVQKIFFIENGIDIEKFSLKSDGKEVRKNFGINEHETVIGTVGRLSEEKGHIYLIEAAKGILKNMKDIKFLIVGDGPFRETLENKVKELDLENTVIFTGIRKDIPELLKIMDIFVLPSLDEAMPIALLEAMASKKPVIASRVGMIPKIVKDGYSGLLVKSGDVKELSDSIRMLLKDKDRTNLLAQKGYEKVKSEFSANKMADKYLEVYKLNMG